VSDLSSSSGQGSGRPRWATLDQRLQIGLLVVVAVVVAALVAAAVVVVTQHGRTASSAPVDSTGCSQMTVPVRYQVNPDARTGTFTTSRGAAAAATNAGYRRDDGILFQVGIRPALGLVGVHQLRKGAGDQLWTTDPDEARQAAKESGYVDQGVVAYVAVVPGPCTVEVERFQSRGVHRYATTTREQDALRAAGWIPETSFYAARPAATGTTPSTGAEPRPTPTPTPAPPTTPAVPPPAGGTPVPGTVVDAHFDDVPVGPVVPDSFIRAVGATNHDPAAYDSMSYVAQPDGSRSRFVRTHLAAHLILDHNDKHGDGTVLVVPLEDQSADSACISYDVRFSAGFEVSAGGKLPGLLGVAPGVSPAEPTGGGSTAHGWSGRVMWLGPKLFKFVRDSGQPDLAVTYLYHPGQATEFGDDVSWGRGLVDGSWHEVRQCYTLNRVGRSDGVLQAWVDGDEVLHRTDVVYRTDPKVHITHLDWSIFRGGDSDAWASDRGGDVDLDNLKITVR
jgi:hypothetical protein